MSTSQCSQLTEAVLLLERVDCSKSVPRQFMGMSEFIDNSGKENTQVS